MCEGQGVVCQATGGGWPGFNWLGRRCSVVAVGGDTSGLDQVGSGGCGGAGG